MLMETAQLKDLDRRPFSATTLLTTVGLLLSFATMSFASVVVTRNGVLPFNHGEVAIVFYATVVNQNSEPYLARLDLDHCCLYLTGNTSDCNAMKPHSGLAVVLQPKTNFNVSLYFVNHYLSQRKGECSLNLLSWKVGEVSETKSNPPPESTSQMQIAFDTHSGPSDILGSFQKFFSQFSDQTPEEINCMLEYVGVRSIHNKGTKSCEITPPCSGARMMISPWTGSCRKIFPRKSIHESISLEMRSAETEVELELEIIKARARKEKVENSASNKSEEASDNNFNDVAMLEPLALKVTCVHGKQGGSGCICDSGWTSKSIEETGSGSLYQMCDVITPEGESMEKSNKNTMNTVVLIICGLLIIIVLCIIAWTFWRKRKTNNGYEAVSKEDSEPAEDVISEITGRRESTPSSSSSPKPDDEETNTASNRSSQTVHKDNASPVPSSNPVEPNPSNTNNSPVTESIENNKSKNIFKEPSLVVLKEATSSKLVCPSRRPSCIKLIPHSRLPTPHASKGNTAVICNNTRGNAHNETKLDMDAILSLTDKEKLHTQSDVILSPKSPISVAEKSTSVGFGHLSAPSTISTKSIPALKVEADVPPKVDGDLTLHQKQEEWAKFLNEFEHKAARRKRSLCTYDEYDKCFERRNNNDDALLVASKVQSMPTMSINPFTSRTSLRLSLREDEMSQTSTSSGHTTPGLQSPTGQGSLSKKSSRLSLHYEELEEMNDAFVLLSKLSETSKHQASEQTSRTSIWSTVASDNTYEPDSVSVSSRTSYPRDLQDSDTETTLPEVKRRLEGISMRNESTSVRELTPATTGINSSETLAFSSEWVDETKSGSVNEGKFLNAAERIELAAKLFGSFYEGKDETRETAFVLESDLIPSQAFMNINQASIASTKTPYSHTFTLDP